MKVNRKDIETIFLFLSTCYPELNKYTLVDADCRCGKRVALAIVTPMSVDPKTDYITYSEMGYLLAGYQLKCNNVL